MLGAWVLSIAAFGTGPEFSQMQMGPAFGTLERLAASIPAERPRVTRIEEPVYGARKAELEALMMYLKKVQEVIGIGKWDDAYQQNFLTVIHQAVSAGERFALLPEELLCWERAGLDLTAAHRNLMIRQLAAGRASQSVVRQAIAAHERFRQSYRTALARCITSHD